MYKITFIRKNGEKEDKLIEHLSIDDIRNRIIRDYGDDSHIIVTHDNKCEEILFLDKNCKEKLTLQIMYVKEK